MYQLAGGTSPPCRILPAEGTVVAWHAVRYVGLVQPQWVQYDWSLQQGGRFHVFGE
jgi:hypothetical protein